MINIIFGSIIHSSHVMDNSFIVECALFFIATLNDMDGWVDGWWKGTLVLFFCVIILRLQKTDGSNGGMNLILFTHNVRTLPFDCLNRIYQVYLRLKRA